MRDPPARSGAARLRLEGDLQSPRPVLLRPHRGGGEIEARVLPVPVPASAQAMRGAPPHRCRAAEGIGPPRTRKPPVSPAASRPPSFPSRALLHHINPLEPGNEPGTRGAPVPPIAIQAAPVFPSRQAASPARSPRLFASFAAGPSASRRCVRVAFIGAIRARCRDASPPLRQARRGRACAGAPDSSGVCGGAIPSALAVPRHLAQMLARAPEAKTFPERSNRSSRLRAHASGCEGGMGHQNIAILFLTAPSASGQRSAAVVGCPTALIARSGCGGPSAVSGLQGFDLGHGLDLGPLAGKNDSRYLFRPPMGLPCHGPAEMLAHPGEITLLSPINCGRPCREPVRCHWKARTAAMTHAIHRGIR